MSLLEDEKKAEERAKSISNERAKLMATYFNGLAIAIIVVGAFSPAFSTPMPGYVGGPSTLFRVVQGFLCLGTSFTLHVLARLALGAIR